MSTRQRLAALVALALILRIAAAVAMGNGLRFADEAAYTDVARQLLAGGGFGDYRGVPGYPVFLAAAWAPLAASIGWLRLAQAVVAALGAGLTFVVAGRLFDRGTATAAALIYALDPLLVVAGGLLYPEAIAAMAMLAVVGAAWEAVRRGSLLCSGLTGLCLGALALLRPVALIVIPVVAVWIALGVAGRFGRRALHAGLVALICLLVLAPWTWRNYLVYHRLIPVSLAGTHVAPAPRAEVERRGLAAAILEEGEREPLMLAGRMAREFGHFWELTPTRLMTDDPVQREALHRRDPRLATEPAFSRPLRDRVSALSFGLELLLAVGGLILAWRARRREALLLALVVLAYALGYSLFVGKLRYRIPVLPLVFMFAGYAAAALYAATRRRGANAEPSRQA